MRESRTNGKPPTAAEGTSPDAETRALNESPEFQEIMAAGDRAIKEGRTRPAADVFRRRRERQRAAAAR